MQFCALGNKVNWTGPVRKHGSLKTSNTEPLQVATFIWDEQLVWETVREINFFLLLLGTFWSEGKALKSLARVGKAESLFADLANMWVCHCSVHCDLWQANSYCWLYLSGLLGTSLPLGTARTRFVCGCNQKIPKGQGKAKTSTWSNYLYTFRICVNVLVHILGKRS